MWSPFFTSSAPRSSAAAEEAWATAKFRALKKTENASEFARVWKVLANVAALLRDLAGAGPATFAGRLTLRQALVCSKMSWLKGC